MKILFIIYDNESRYNPLPLGAAYVAGYVRANGYPDVHYYSQDVYHYSEEHLHDYLKHNRFDVVAVGHVSGYYQNIKIKRICDAITSLPDRPFIVLGGHGPSPIPEYSIRHTGADAVVMGEAEVPMLNLLRALENKTSLHDVKGLAFREGDNVVVNEREPAIKDLDTIPFPYFEALPMEYYFKWGSLTDTLDRAINMSAQRGCVYLCNFCYRMEKGIRFRSVDNIVEEIKKYKRDYNISYIFFTDELFMVSKKRVFELCERFIAEKLNIRYLCTGRLDIATTEILDIMKASGCAAIDYGIEQYDDHALKMMDKKQTCEQTERTIKLTLERGINPLFNIIFGNTGDTRESLRRSLDFLNKYNDYHQLRVIRPVTPYPGSPLYFEAIKRGLLTGPEDFYNKHVNLELLTVNFTDIPDDEFHQLLFEANKDIIDRYYEHMKQTQTESFRKVYFEKEFSFRGARH